MNTPEEQKKAADRSSNVLGVKSAQLKTVDLPSGKQAHYVDAKGKHVREAQRLMDGDPDKMMFALISVCTAIDGRRLAIEDLDEMSAGDCMALMGVFGSAFQ